MAHAARGGDASIWARPTDGAAHGAPPPGATRRRGGGAPAPAAQPLQEAVWAATAGAAAVLHPFSTEEPHDHTPAPATHHAEVCALPLPSCSRSACDPLGAPVPPPVLSLCRHRPTPPAPPP